MEKGKIIGQGVCTDCGQTVNLKQNVNGNVYWYCDGKAGPGMCQAHHRYNPWRSREIVERLEREKSNDNAARQSRPEPVPATAGSGGPGLADPPAGNVEPADGQPAAAGKRRGLLRSS